MTTPGMRASDADRQQAADLLSEHLSAGRLTLTEYDQRLATVYAAVYVADIAPVFDDLPGGGPRYRARADRSEAGRATEGPAGLDLGGLGAAARDAMGSVRESVRRAPGRPHPALLVLAVFGGLLLVGALVHVLLHLVVPILVVAAIVVLVGRRHRARGRGPTRHDWGPQHAGRPGA